jgi:hypothetical protein
MIRCSFVLALYAAEWPEFADNTSGTNVRNPRQPRSLLETKWADVDVCPRLCLAQVYMRVVGTRSSELSFNLLLLAPVIPKNDIETIHHLSCVQNDFTVVLLQLQRKFVTP